MISDKYKKLIGTKYGFLTLIDVREFTSEKNKKNCSIIFICKCGVKKEYTPSKANPIMRGSTISCGCFRKRQWIKDYYAFQASNK